ncbi:MAG: hypothetical protein XE08_0255 [Parcubacteria bacterium 32_520]|nr:MAG: hypothetical protein XD75_0460 [Parcubacteria bacterium 33_209]KUK99071.1 MAG: hypothetical protein XE08_0255 [Parcubacteria bacterium 32_520]
MGYRLLKDELMRALALVGQGSDSKANVKKELLEVEEMTEKTRQWFVDQLRKQTKLWEQLIEKDTDYSTQSWLFEKTAEVILMSDEKARLNQKIYGLQLNYDQTVQEIIMENPEIAKILKEMETLLFQVKSLDIQIDRTLEQIYDVVGAKLGDLREELDLELPEEKEEVDGYG